MQENVDKKFESFWEKFVKEFCETGLPEAYDVARSVFLVSYRSGYADGQAAATRKTSPQEEAV